MRLIRLCALCFRFSLDPNRDRILRCTGKPRAVAWRRSLCVAALLIALSMRSGHTQSTVPIEIIDGAPIVEVKLDNGRTAHMLLDTGAATTIFSRAGAARLQLKPGPVPPEYRGVLVGTGMLPEIHVGGQRAEQVPFGVVSTRRNVWSIIKGKDEIDGSLGIDVLSRYAVGLDMVGKTITFWRGGHLTAQEQAGWFGAQQTVSSAPLSRLDDSFYWVSTRLDGVPVQYMFDSGAVDLNMPQRFLTVLPPLQRLDRYQVAAVDRTENDVAYVYRSFAVGTFEVPFPYLIGTSGKSALITMPTIGMRLFNDCKLLLDFPAERLSLAAIRTGTRTKIEILARLGAFIVGGTAQEVFHIAAGSPAERAGLRTGDRLLHYDGFASSNRSKTTEQNAAQQPDPPITFQVRRRGTAAPLTIILNRAADTAWMGMPTIDQFPNIPSGYTGVKRFPRGGIFQDNTGRTQLVAPGSSLVCQNGQFFAFGQIAGIKPDADQAVGGNLRVVGSPDDPTNPPQLADGEGTIWVAGKGWIVGPANTTVSLGGYGLTLAPSARTDAGAKAQR